ncbi:MAG: FAD-dependent oxidoreductase [Armatimonadetes bacterium]|nr:FAD-dependent oxidoreductase [Armatimonadota bacterium]
MSDRQEGKKYEVVIIGAGPAGLAAAATAARYGVPVCLVESSHQVGGRYFKYAKRTFRSEQLLNLMLREVSINRSSELLCGASAIWIERQTDGSFKILLKTRFGLTAVEAHTVIIAVGAYERHLPFPGWTSRCVLSMGAAQMLLRSDCLNSIKRAVLSGTGPLLWKVASEMCDNGIKVMVVSFASLSHCLKQFQALATCPRELIEAIACLLSIVRHSARVLFRHAVVFVNAKNDVEVFVAPVDEVGAPNISESISHRCDLVAIGHGRK